MIKNYVVGSNGKSCETKFEAVIKNRVLFYFQNLFWAERNIVQAHAIIKENYRYI